MAIKGCFRGSSRKRSAASAAFGKENGNITAIDAVKSGDIKALRRLLMKKPNTEETDDRGRTALLLAAQVGDGNAGLMLLQDPDNLLFRETAALHVLVLIWARTNFKLD